MTKGKIVSHVSHNTLILRMKQKLQNQTLNISLCEEENHNTSLRAFIRSLKVMGLHESEKLKLPFCSLYHFYYHFTQFK